MIRNDASRTLMGSHQENWFYGELSRSSKRGAAWRVVGNQIVFSHIIESYGLSGDNWSVSCDCTEISARNVDLLIVC